MDLTSPIRLANGVAVPRLALGTFKAKGGEVKEAVKAALAAGYRHIDTASIYKNEAEIGEAIRESGMARDEVFITSKASPYEHGFQQVLAACAASLERLQTDYLVRPVPAPLVRALLMPAPSFSTLSQHPHVIRCCVPPSIASNATPSHSHDPLCVFLASSKLISPSSSPWYHA
ncbi:hypothetical protein CLOM_g23666 [Closterium sp. NIES-68]|nr:hypothetical protein CLOM_g23666 [Closterium sp. NIES-68]GJP86888.1 hypothetical protein CLOP_g16860 [Closterium sp. NIES-67]